MYISRGVNLGAGNGLTTLTHILSRRGKGYLTPFSTSRS